MKKIKIPRPFSIAFIILFSMVIFAIIGKGCYGQEGFYINEKGVQKSVFFKLENFQKSSEEEFSFPGINLVIKTITYSYGNLSIFVFTLKDKDFYRNSLEKNLHNPLAGRAFFLRKKGQSYINFNPPDIFSMDLEKIGNPTCMDYFEKNLSKLFFRESLSLELRYLGP